MFGKSHSNPTVMKHSFSRVPSAEIQRSAFDRSHGHKTTLDAGYLVPFLVDELLPGDTYRVDTTAFLRLATPIFPIMDNAYVDIHYYAVPMRLLWENWERMNGAQDAPDDPTDFTMPQMVSPVGGYLEMSLSDYFGIPTKIAGLSHHSLFHRAYNLIWNTWYRDQNLQDPVVVDLDDGPDSPSDYVLLRRGKRHDYFTSSLPWPQKGDAVTMALGSSAPVVGNLENVQGLSAVDAGTRNVILNSSDNRLQLSGAAVTNGASLRWPTAAQGETGLEADLSAAVGPTINSLRQAVAIQQVLEADARGGTRYVELIKAQWNVVSPDFRMQRPEYLGGGSAPLNVSPIPQTNSTDATSPQGNLAAMGTALNQGNGFTYSSTEHQLLIGVISVRADLTYQAGLNRMFSRLTRFDFYMPKLAQIGEQAVLMKEINALGTAGDDDVWGYQERAAEYRYKPSTITGLMRSNATGTLEAWHLSQELVTPTLDADFIQEDPPFDRVIATPAEPHFIMDTYIRMHCARPMPLFGVPGLRRL